MSSKYPKNLAIELPLDCSQDTKGGNADLSQSLSLVRKEEVEPISTNNLGALCAAKDVQ